MLRRFLRPGARLVFAFAVFAVLAIAITSRTAKWLMDFDQSLYLTIAYDLDRHRVFSNGVFDDVDSTEAAPPAGMFFSPLYPWLVAAAMKIDPRFSAAVACGVEANHHKRDPAGCDIYATPMQVLHALLLTFGVLAIARAGEAIFASERAFYLAGVLATAGTAAEAELFSYLMTESVWFSLYSLLMLAFLLALATWRTRYFVLSGIVLGVLCLTRPSFLVLVPTLLVLLFVYARWLTDAPRPWLRHGALFALSFLVLIAPWVARNYLSVGRLGFTEEYGSATLVERFAFNDMRPREFALAFPYCVPVVGPAWVGRLFGFDAMRRFEWNQTGSFFDIGRARRMTLVKSHGRLDPVIWDLVREEMRQNWWRHLATIVPLAWCGLWVAGIWSLMTLPLFAWACVAAVRRGKTLFLLYAAPAVVLVGLHAAIANHYARYNLGLIGPFSVGAAWVVSRGIMSRRPQGGALRV